MAASVNNYQMETVREENPDDETMIVVYYDNSKEDEESADEDDSCDDDDCSWETIENRYHHEHHEREKVQQDDELTSEADSRDEFDERNGDVMPRRLKRRREDIYRARDGPRAAQTASDNVFNVNSDNWSESEDWFGANSQNSYDSSKEDEESAHEGDSYDDYDCSVETTVIGFDESMLLHEENPETDPHPERPDQLRAILARLAAEGIHPGRRVKRQAREATPSELEQFHSREHVDLLETTCNNEEINYITSDTSLEPARLAAGISADLATAIVKGEVQNGFAVVRPPGHHAGEEVVMGFCMHNNASVAAKAAQAAGAKKVLILDLDVHHGSGTQDIFEDDPSVLYMSLHRYENGDFYPGPGAAEKVGSGKGEGYSVNIPWICGGIGDRDYIYAFLQIVLPIAEEFAPDMTIISAGFDGARGDPLGGCEITPSGYAHMTSMLNSLSGGKMLVILEGGYNLRSISASASAVIKVLLGDSPGPPLEDIQPTEAGAISILDVVAAQAKYWPTLLVPEFLRRSKISVASKNHPKKEHLAAEELLTL